MKNGKLMTDYLDACAETQRLTRSGTLEDAREALRRVKDGVTDHLWDALLADGWTIPEIDAAYERRFGYRVRRGG